MVKTFSIPCNFGGQIRYVIFSIGQPSPDHHPIHFQAAYVSGEKGGTIPQDIMDSLAKLYELACKYGVLFEDLCYYAINVANGSIPNDNADFAKIIKDVKW